MDSILRDLYDGALRPSRYIPQDKEYQNLIELEGKRIDALAATLTPDQYTQLEKLYELHTEIQDFEMVACFQNGFAAGALMLAESFGYLERLRDD